MPATLVDIGLKLLLSLGSKVSMWLGPPSSPNKITLFALGAEAGEAAAAASVSRRVRPRNPREPTVRRSRRDVEYLAMIVLSGFRRTRASLPAPRRIRAAPLRGRCGGRGSPLWSQRSPAAAARPTR